MGHINCDNAGSPCPTAIAFFGVSKPEILSSPSLPKVKKKMQLNAIQKSVLQDYDNGEFAYLANQDAIDLGECDPLLAFILIELGKTGTTDSPEETGERMDLAIRELEVAIKAIQKIQAALLAHEDQPALI